MTAREPEKLELQKNNRTTSVNRWRGWLLLGTGSLLVTVGGWLTWAAPPSLTNSYAGSTCLRVGVVLIALWLAMPALKKPISWLPPGIVVGILIGIAMIAAQPRLIFVVAPFAGMVFALGAFLRVFKRS